MISHSRECYRVAELMKERGIGIGELVCNSGVGAEIVRAIAYQRYTPSPEQRKRVSQALGLQPQQIIWGHATCVDASIHQPV